MISSLKFACFMSAEAREQRRINQAIEKQIKKDKKGQGKELKLLLLGIVKNILIFTFHKSYYN
jgi:hypothetical protein